MKLAMLDFETLSLRSNAVLLSVGVIQFDEEFVPHDMLRIDFNVGVQIKAGRHISADTLEFWAGQPIFAETLKASNASKIFMPQAVHTLLSFLNEADGGVWTCGAKDVAWLESISEDFNTGYVDLPKYNLFRDFRTIREQAYSQGYKGVPVNFDIVMHDPISDCRWQIAELKGAFDHLGLSLHEAVA